MFFALRYLWCGLLKSRRHISVCGGRFVCNACCLLFRLSYVVVCLCCAVGNTVQCAVTLWCVHVVLLVTRCSVQLRCGVLMLCCW
jgi:hypothetical protein